MCSHHLGIAAFERGEFKTARDYFELNLKEAKETGNRDSEGNTYVNLGRTYRSLGEFKKALELCQMGLGIFQETGNRDSEGKTYVNLGNAYHSLGEFKKALELYQMGLSIFQETGNRDSEGTAYGNLGNAYHSLGEFKKALELYQIGLSIFQETGNRDSEGTAYVNLGNTYLSLGEFKKALELCQMGLRIAKETGNRDSVGNAYVNLGVAYWALGVREKGSDYFRESLRVAKETENKGLEGTAYGLLGAKCHLLGDSKNAIVFYQKCLSIAKVTGNKDLEGKADGALGVAYVRLGDLKKGIEFQKQCLSIAKQTGNKSSQMCAFKDLGQAYWFFGDLCRAEEFLKSSINKMEEIRVLLQEKDEWKISFRNKFKTHHYLWYLQLQQGKIMEALSTAEQGRAQALVDLIKCQFGVQSFRSLSEGLPEGVYTFSGDTSSPTIFIAENAESVNLWLLPKGQKWYFSQQKLSQTLENLTRKLYNQIGVKYGVGGKGRPLSQDESDALKTLHEMIIAPLSDWITGDELIIVPDGPSFLIPYAALVDHHSRYLSETLRIRLAPSLTSLWLLTECPEGYHSPSGALLVGNPWVETVRIKGCKPFPPLPAGEREVEMIGQILNIEPLTGKNATKDQVLSRLNSVSLVHIAAHGRSGTGEIILSPNIASSKRPRQEDFLLTIADVLNAPLRAKLVVLSCCCSGVGKIQAEGVVGIARAFLGAGARSVVATLWAIDDDATLAFMKKFYEHLVAGQSASKSLSHAMKWMRESEDFKAVKHWAPFVLIGDDVTMDFGQSR